MRMNMRRKSTRTRRQKVQKAFPVKSRRADGRRREAASAAECKCEDIFLSWYAIFLLENCSVLASSVCGAPLINISPHFCTAGYLHVYRMLYYRHSSFHGEPTPSALRCSSNAF